MLAVCMLFVLFHGEVLAQEELAAAARLVGLSPLACAILAIALVALLWTWIGGMATVVWTDALLFLLFVGGMAGMLIVLHLGVGGGLAVRAPPPTVGRAVSPDAQGAAGRGELGRAAP